MNEYRTAIQMIDIDEEVFAGNWKAASIKCFEYGFFAKDLIDRKEELDAEMGQDYINMSFGAIAILAEMACKYRFTK